MAANKRLDIEFLPNDGPLRDDVNRLGRIVGEMLAEQHGGGFFDTVERLRTTAIELRAADAGPAELVRQLDGLEPVLADRLTRAFSTYFRVVNIAERVHRIRRRRDYERLGASPQPDGLHDRAFPHRPCLAWPHDRARRISLQPRCARI